jgi:hypothetical protein
MEWLANNGKVKSKTVVTINCTGSKSGKGKKNGGPP